MFWLNLLFCIIAIFFWVSLILWQCKKSIHGWLLNIFYKPPEIPKNQELGFTHLFPEHEKKSSPEDSKDRN